MPKTQRPMQGLTSHNYTGQSVDKYDQARNFAPYVRPPDFNQATKNAMKAKGQLPGESINHKKSISDLHNDAAAYGKGVITRPHYEKVLHSLTDGKPLPQETHAFLNNPTPQTLAPHLKAMNNAIPNLRPGDSHINSGIGKYMDLRFQDSQYRSGERSPSPISGRILTSTIESGGPARFRLNAAAEARSSDHPAVSLDEIHASLAARVDADVSYKIDTDRKGKLTTATFALDNTTS